MITLRPYDPQKDRAALERWWKLRGQPELHPQILPRGWVASAAGVDMAVSFLYLVEGKIGVIEWTTVNPQMAAGPDTIEAVKALYEHLENEAWSANCPIVISFVAPNSWEHRTLGKRGYVAAGGAHVMLAKPFERGGTA